MKNKRYMIFFPVLIIGLSIFFLLNNTIIENFSINSNSKDIVNLYSGKNRILSVDDKDTNGLPVKLQVNKNYQLKLEDAPDAHSGSPRILAVMDVCELSLALAIFPR